MIDFLSLFSAKGDVLMEKSGLLEMAGMSGVEHSQGTISKHTFIKRKYRKIYSYYIECTYYIDVYCILYTYIRTLIHI